MGRKILITGASRGIGQATAVCLSLEGYELVLHARRPENLVATLGMIAPGSNHHILTGDFSNPIEFQQFLKLLGKEHKDLYGVVSNAGITRDKSIIYQPEKEIDELLLVNLKVPILLGKWALKQFIKRKSGVFIHLGSCTGETGNAFQSVYSASKAALVALSKSWARECQRLLSDHQIRIVTLSPGIIETDLTEVLPKQIKDNYLSNIPSGRFGRAGEVASCINFLLSDQAGYLNGSEVKLNGGML